MLLPHPNGVHWSWFWPAVAYHSSPARLSIWEPIYVPKWTRCGLGTSYVPINSEPAYLDSGHARTPTHQGTMLYFDKNSLNLQCPYGYIHGFPYGQGVVLQLPTGLETPNSTHRWGVGPFTRTWKNKRSKSVRKKSLLFWEINLTVVSGA